MRKIYLCLFTLLFSCYDQVKLKPPCFLNGQDLIEEENQLGTNLCCESGELGEKLCQAFFEEYGYAKYILEAQTLCQEQRCILSCKSIEDCPQLLLKDMAMLNEKDQSQEDQRFLVDHDLSTVEDMMIREDCAFPAIEIEGANDDLASQEVVKKAVIPGPILDLKIWAGHVQLNQDVISYLLIRGGSLERVESNQQQIWKTSSFGLQKIIGVFDFDQDGVLEILVQSDVKIYLFDMESGQLLWKEEDTPIENEPSFLGLNYLSVEDLYQDGRMQIYFADAGCVTAGTGSGQILNIQSPSLNMDQRTNLINNPQNRTNGKCPLWHSLLPKNAFQSTIEENPSVMITDNQGLHRFDAKTGEKKECGLIDGMKSAGAMPYLTLDYPNAQANSRERAWLGFLDQKIVLLKVQAPLENEPENHCTDDQKRIRPFWTYPLPQGAIQFSTVRTNTPLLKAVHLIDMNADQINDIISHFYLDGQWYLVAINGANGTEIQRWPGYALLGVWKNRYLLVAKNADATLTPPYTLNLLDIDITQPQVNLIEKWMRDISSAQPSYFNYSGIGHTKEFNDLITIGTGENEKIVLYEFAGFENKKSLIFSNETNSLTYTFRDSFGTFTPVCPNVPQNQINCKNNEKIAVTLDNGEIILFDDQKNILQESNADIYPHVYKPSNTIAFKWVNLDQKPLILSFSKTGKLSLRNPEEWIEIDEAITEEAIERVVWEKKVGYPSYPLYRPARIPNLPLVVENAQGGGMVIHGFYLVHTIAWVGLDLRTGNEQWRHELDSESFNATVLNGSGGKIVRGENQNIFVRDDRFLKKDIQLLTDQCETRRFIVGNQSFDTLPSDFFNSSPNCPPSEVNDIKPRILSALDINTGRCIWQNVIKLNDACVGPSNINISVTDVDHNQIDEIYITETNAIRQFDANGNIINTANISEQLGIATGGGVVTAFPENQEQGLLRYGALKPIHGLNADLSQKWLAADIPSLKDSSWISRNTILSNQYIYISPGPSLALSQYDYMGNFIKNWQFNDLLEGEKNVDPLRLGPEFLYMDKAQGTSDESHIWLSLDNNYLFELDSDFNTIWKKNYTSSVSTPKLSDFDHDQVLEWAISLDEGEIWLYDKTTYAAPPKIWEVPCNEPSFCDEDNDIDLILQNDRICFNYIPMKNIDGLEARIENEIGNAITPWQNLSYSGKDSFSHLKLLVNRQYKLAYRFWILDQSQNKLVSLPQYSDGFSVEDQQEPLIDININYDSINRFLSIKADAIDNIGLSAWKIEIYAPNSEKIKSMNGFIEGFEWHENFMIEEPLLFSTPGEYQVNLYVIDQARNSIEKKQTLMIDAQ